MKRSLTVFAALAAVLLAGCGEDDKPAGETAAPESGEALLQRAIDKIQSGEVEAAAAAADAARVALPDSAEARLADGQVAYLRKDYARATDDFNAVAAEKTLPAALRSDALASRAVVEIARNEFDAARLSLLRALRLNRRNATAWYHLGLLSRNTYHFDEAAMEQFEMAARLSDPKEPRTKAIMQDIVPALRASLAQAAAARPGAAQRDAGTAAKLIAEAEALEKKRQTTAATKKYAAAFAADPFSYPAATNYARLLVAKEKKTREDVDRALAAYRAAIDQRPAAQANYQAAAQLAYANRRWATAVAIMNRAVAHDPENIRSLDLLIAALQKAGRGRQAEDWKAYRRDLSAR